MKKKFEQKNTIWRRNNKEIFSIRFTYKIISCSNKFLIRKKMFFLPAKRAYGRELHWITCIILKNNNLALLLHETLGLLFFRIDLVLLCSIQCANLIVKIPCCLFANCIFCQTFFTILNVFFTTHNDFDGYFLNKIILCLSMN